MSKTVPTEACKVLKENGATTYLFNEKTPEQKCKSDENIVFESRIGLFKLLQKDWRRYLVILSPIALAWLPLMSDTSEARCGYIILLMAIYYMTEALPLAVTALMPVFCFPLLGIISTDAICRVYMRGTAMMFFGGLACAIAVEHCNLHKRIALFVILKVGQSPRKLMGSFMFTSMFLSMWISNTAATAMMVPILDAILQELYRDDATNKVQQIQKGTDMLEMRISPAHQSQQELVENCDSVKNSPVVDDFIDPDLVEDKKTLVRANSEERLAPPDKESQALSTMYFLATAYGSNLGGTGFPTGTGPNLVLWGILQSSFPEGTGLNFATWMAFNIPGMLICVFVTWGWLEIMFMGCCGCRKFPKSTKEKEGAIRKLVQKHYDSLGKVTFHEMCVTVLFSILVFLWVFRAPEFITGWADLVQGAFPKEFKVGNATPAILIVFLLFVVPSKPPWIYSDEPTPACLTWDAVHKKVPWGLVILMGGGFAMAEGASESGLSNWIKIQLTFLQVLPGQAIVFLVCLITTFLTEIISNITAASILLPVLKDMAIGINMHPLYLMLPGAVCCSYAFMLPVANPPNAIAFNASTMKNSDMIKAGFMLNIFCIFIMTGLINSLGMVLFDLNTFPAWAMNNATALTNAVMVETLGNTTLASYS